MADPSWFDCPIPACPADREARSAALLEAFRLGRVRLFQEAPFAPLYVEPVGLLEGDLERTA